MPFLEIFLEMVRLSELPWWLVMWTAEHRVIEGCDVRVAHSAENAGDVFKKVGDALSLIARHRPRLAARLRRDVKHLLFADVSGGRYLAGLQVCLIAVGYARRVPPLELAMMIVHEATHARLSRAGFRYVGECRERLERICVRAEVAFAQCVPGSRAAVEKAQAMEQSQWWDPEKSAEATLAELRRRGVPAWVMAVLRRLVRRTRLG